MERKQMSGKLPYPGYEALALLDQHKRNLCDGLSQRQSVDSSCEADQ